MTRRRRPRLGLGFAAVGLLAAAIFPAFQRARSPVGLAVVADAVGLLRPVEGRLSALGGHESWPAEGAVRRLPTGLRRQLREWDAAAADGSPSALRQQAGVRLLGDRTSDAIDLLERAVAAAPADAAAWTDLSAALLERAREPDHRYDAVRALAAADRAVVLEPASLAARFNLALALSRLHLRSQAIRAWSEYLEDEHDPGWRAEAEARLAALARPTPAERWTAARGELIAASLAARRVQVAALVSRYPRASRELALHELLPAWAEARGTWDGLVEPPPLRAAGAVGAALLHASGDALVVDAVAAVRAAVAGPSGRRAAEDLAAGHLAYREARRLYDGSSYGAARERFAEAERLLAAGGSPAAGWAALHVAICDYYLEDYETVRRSLAEVRASFDAERLPALAAELLWMEGLTDHVTARPGAALDRFDRALGLYRRTGDREGATAIHAFTSGVYAFLGAEREAWRHRHRALAGLDDFHVSRRAVSLLGAAAAAAAEDASAALRFQNEAVATAEAGGVPLERAVAHLARARLPGGGRDADGSERDLAAAHRASDEIDDPELRAALDAEIDLAEAHALLSSEDAPGAEAAAARAFAYFEGKGKDLYSIDALGLLARAAALDGRPDDEERHLRRAIEIIEAQRERVLAEPLRISFFDRPSHQRIYDRLVEILALERGGPIEALAVVERSRARALLDRLGEKKGRPELARFDRPLTPEEIQRELPEGTALVVFSVLERQTLAWVVTRERIEFEQIPLTAEAIERAVAETAPTLLLQQAFSTLDRHLVDVASIVIMAEGGLLRPPVFDTLAVVARDASSGPPELAITPSGTVYARSLAAQRTLAARRLTRVLAIGDPAFDRRLFPDLAPLPDARREARAVAKVFPESTLLIGPDATRERFFEAAPRVDVVFVASHAVADARRPERAALALAVSPGGVGGAVYAHEIAALDLSAVSLVFLAGCETADGTVSRGEGPLSLGRAFLAAGVPVVIGSWHELRDEYHPDILTFFRDWLGESPPSGYRLTIPFSVMGALTSYRGGSE